MQDLKVRLVADGLTPWVCGDSGMSLKSILEVLQSGAAFLERKGVESARLNMEHLLAHALGLKRLDLYRQFDRPLSDAELGPLREWTVRRAAGEPLQHLLGTVDFHQFTFRCDARALIPRPETEELVEKVMVRRRSDPPFRVVDMGCGSGVIGLSLAAVFSSAQVVLVDASLEALALARENAALVAAQLAAAAAVPEYVPLGAVGEGGRVAEVDGSMDGVGMAGARRGADAVASAFLDRLAFVVSDLWAGMEVPGDAERFDLVVANLPYIPRLEVATLSREVRWDPELALIGGEDGSEVMERFLAGARRFCASGALVALEHGPDQGEVIGARLVAEGFEAVSLELDLSGRPRFSFGTAPMLSPA